MGISDRIEAFITELMRDDENEWVELKRNELAAIFNCVPSQINYVISTRFNPERGYAVESRRGGGGYLRIRRIQKENPIRGVICNIGDSIDFMNARACIIRLTEIGIADEKTARVMINAISDNSLIISQPHKDILRASILKNMLTAL